MVGPASLFRVRAHPLFVNRGENVAKRKKKVIVPGNASKRRYEEEHRPPESKYNISKGGWFALVACSAILLIASALTSNIVFAAAALAIIIFVDRYGKDYILADYNDLLEKRRMAMGMSEDLTEAERKGLMRALTDERIRVRRERKDRKRAERLGMTYEEYLRSKGEDAAQGPDAGEAAVAGELPEAAEAGRAPEDEAARPGEGA